MNAECGMQIEELEKLVLNRGDDWLQSRNLDEERQVTLR